MSESVRARTVDDGRMSIGDELARREAQMCVSAPCVGRAQQQSTEVAKPVDQLASAHVMPALDDAALGPESVKV